MASSIVVSYNLLTSEAPVMASNYDRSWPIADEIQSLVYRYETPRLPSILHFRWTLSKTYIAPLFLTTPCTCGKP